MKQQIKEEEEDEEDKEHLAVGESQNHGWTEFLNHWRDEYCEHFEV